jgi:hypothetical protein
MLRKEEMR